MSLVRRKSFYFAFTIGALMVSALIVQMRAEDHPMPKLAPMPLGRAMFLAVAVDGHIFCIGGNDKEANSIPTVHAYDTAANTWVEKAKWPTPSGYPCGAGVNGKVYVVGGASGKDGKISAVERYDPKTDKWERLADLPVPRSHGVAVALGESLYVIGGHGLTDSETGKSVGDLDDVAVLDTRTGRWAKGPRLPKPVHGMSAAVVNGAIHVFGGLTDKTRHFVLDGGQWKPRADVPFGVIKMSATTAYGKAVVIGGGESMSKVAVYDPKTDKWTLGKNSGVPRFLAQAVTVSDSIYALGGVIPDKGAQSQTKLECYDAVKDRWLDWLPARQR